MRTTLFLSASFLLLLTGMVAAQQPDTNFPTGPQYLVTAPSGSVLQPIGTPTISPSKATGVVSPQTGEAQPVTLPTGPGPANLGAVYWGEPNSVVEVLQPPPPNPLPQGYIDTGVQGIATDQTLHAQGYGITVAQAARYWKQQKRQATHVYTNEDLRHLPNT